MSFNETDYSHWCKYNPIDIPEGNFWESFSQDRLQNYWAFNAYNAAKEKYIALAESNQAQIDALMLEYCPDEMTKDQIANWESHQRPVRAQLCGSKLQP